MKEVLKIIGMMLLAAFIAFTLIAHAATKGCAPTGMDWLTPPNVR